MTVELSPLDAVRPASQETVTRHSPSPFVLCSTGHTSEVAVSAIAAAIRLALPCRGGSGERAMLGTSRFPKTFLAPASLHLLNTTRPHFFESFFYIPHTHNFNIKLHYGDPSRS
jgi:hypothetical protein